MKINYEKPMIEFESYELNTAIASGCGTGTVISLGPADDTHGACDEYQEVLDYEQGGHYDATTANFYEDNCSCYLSAGDSVVFTS